MYSELLERHIVESETSSSSNMRRILTQGVNNETDRIEAKAWLDTLTKDISSINDLLIDIIIRNEAIYIVFKFNDYSGHACKGGIKVTENIISTLNELLILIELGDNSIKEINSKLSEAQAENGAILNVKYRWGFGKTSTVAYWDYTNIVIRLGEKSIRKISGDYDIESLNLDIKWEDNIAEFIKRYNESGLSNALDSKVVYSEVIDVLKENMLSVQDIREILKSNMNKTSSQKLKSVHILNELGVFAALVLWEIDYNNHSISVDILDNKVIDIENSRFVSDHSLYSRIEQKMLDSVIGVTEEFKALASGGTEEAS